jgi:hypothetical protein
LDVGRFASADRHPRSELGKGCSGKTHCDCGCEKTQGRIHAASTRGDTNKNIDASANGDANAVEYGMHKRQATDKSKTLGLAAFHVDSVGVNLCRAIA